MALSVNPATHVISIPKSDLTLVSGTLYTMDTNAFRLELKAWEDDVHGGAVHLKTHDHNTEVTVAGITYSRTVEILSPYSVTFEDGQYSVRLEGSNNNVWDIGAGILNQNQVQVIPTNSAGLITISTGSGLSTAEHDQLMALDTEYLEKIIKNKRELKKNGLVWELIVYDDNGTTEMLNKKMKDSNGDNITDLAAGTLAAELANSI